MMEASAERTEESFDAHRQQLIRANLPLAAAVLSLVTILYGSAELVLNPPGFQSAAIPYLFLVAMPWVAVWLAHGPLAHRAEHVALATDVLYTAVLGALLLQPVTTLSGAALFFTLKMVATALFFAWRARTQYFSASIALAVYWGVVAYSGRVIEARSGLHQLLGPLIAAVFSIAGARSAESRRRDLFERGGQLAESARQLQGLLASVRESEAQLRRQQNEQQIIFDSVPALIWYKDCENRIIRANRAAADAAGVPVESLQGRSTYELYPDDAEKYYQDDLEVIRSGQPRRGILDPFQTGAGERRWMQTDKIPYRDEAGNILGVVVFAVDITERRSAEEALAASTRQLEREAEVSTALARVGQALISTLDTPVILERLCTLTMEALDCDLSHVLRIRPDTQEGELVSGAGFTAVEWEPLRLLRPSGRALSPLLRQLDRDEVVELNVDSLRNSLLKVVANQYEVTSTLSVALRRGGKIFGALTAGFRHSQRRFGTQETRILRGIAQLASLALENARLVEELARANGIKSEFVATMSHELRTPLNVITGYGSLLVDGEFGDINRDQKSTLERILRSASELLELINETLDLSRLEAGRVAVDIREVRLRDIFREIDAEIRDRLKPDVHLDWQAAADLPIIESDPVKVKVVLKNLVANALKFTESGSVRISAQAVGDGVEIAVVDTGIGIAPDVLPIIFEAFRQADSSTTRRYGGVGLGLYIVQRLLVLLQGEVGVESAVAVGTTFRVRLPGSIRQRSAA